MPPAAPPLRAFELYSLAETGSEESIDFASSSSPRKCCTRKPIIGLLILWLSLFAILLIIASLSIAISTRKNHGDSPLTSSADASNSHHISELEAPPVVAEKVVESFHHHYPIAKTKLKLNPFHQAQPAESDNPPVIHDISANNTNGTQDHLGLDFPEHAIVQ